MDLDLDLVITELGQFGRYQSSVLLLLIFSGIYTTLYSVSYIFTASTPKSRCNITECENGLNFEYNPIWLSDAVPVRNGNPSACERYKQANFSINFNNCTDLSFDHNKVEKCSNLLFETNENTMPKEFNLLCDENKWKVTSVGTLNSVGQFIGMPIGGYLSDRFGRKRVLITGSVLSAMMGIARSFAPSYLIFLVFEFLDAAITCGVTSTIFILAIELVGPERRVLASTLYSCFTFPLGEIILAGAVWWLQDWRIYLRVLYTPGILFILYIWLIPESLRWLITQKRYSEIKSILNKVAEVNNKKLHVFWEQTLDSLEAEQSEIKAHPATNAKKIQHEKELGPMDLLNSNILLLRLANCSMCWMVQTFVFYGLAMNSVVLPGNKSVNFMLTALAEIPGYIAYQFTLDSLGRKISFFLFVTSAGMSCVLFYFIPLDMAIIRLVSFLVGKSCITASFTIIYMLTSEMFPTSLRNSTLGFCSMFGRIGSMIVVQTPLVANIISPYLLFGLLAIICGLLALLLPETFKIKLPDTIQEAENIGKIEPIGKEEKYTKTW